MRFSVSVLAALLLFTTASAGLTIRESQTSFQLYAYGEGLGGLTLFSAGGNAYLGDYKLLNDSQAAPVLFTTTEDAWLGSPNTTNLPGSDVPTWSHYTLAVPSDQSSSHQVIFLESSSDLASGLVTNCFTFYGTIAFVVTASGKMESLWYAVPSDTEGVYTLKWNDQSGKGVILIIKSTPPSN
ncbi:hypothetical protein B0J13DRAFT_611598 [Dactylonectria estremocensis]|uniref:Uncharacterized protein n=1 Tax=Dactylonectria estremocensis TaxID=1079267 RepID=A0A9P9IPR6_9HYPO|nr:hypothetical protein B0J13DRAFT_611598 [Dactylonectria estremocensis]